MSENETKPQNASLKKEAMLQALEKSLGIVTTACKSVGIDRKTHYRWLHDDEAYAEAVDALTDVTLDFAESQLHKKILDGDTTATIFFLKTKGKRRGYIERQEVAGVNDAPLQVMIYDKL
jgi:hypothetical protein